MNIKTILDIRDNWLRTIQILFVSIVILFLFYFQTVSSIAEKWWTSDTYAHGMVIIPFSLYMIWMHRRHLTPLQPRSTLWGMALLLPTVLIWLLGAAVDVLVIQQLALLGMIWALVLTVLGWSTVKQIIFPLAFLIFVVPLGEGLIPILMDITAIFTVKALQLTGIPVFWEGMYFAIPSGNFEVAKACSGVRYLFASIALGCLFAYINFYSFKKRALFILLSILLPIVANGLRAYGIVLIAHYSNLKYAVGVDHLIYGWLFFGLIMFLLFYIGSKWNENEPVIQTTNAEPVNKDTISRITIPILFLLVASAGPISMLRVHSEYTPSNETVLQIPQGHEKWRQVESSPVQPWDIDFKGASHEVKTAYTNESHLVQLYISYYATESQGKEVINQSNRLHRIKQWTEVKRSEVEVVLPHKTVRLHEKVLRSGEQERILWYGYDLDGFVTTNIYIGKLVQAWQRLIGNKHGGAAIVLMADVLSDRQETIDQMHHFTNVMYPSIEYSLSAARKTH